ncbi:glycoside hydrolase [Phellopilus nigrolimitatus]|nr:glycoside hydrolase [Phellopilus nigrolimitatus]
MPRIPSVSPATGKPANSHFIHTVDSSFVDNNGRTLLLRGVNLSGSAKAPVDEPTYCRDALWDAGENGDTSFLGRPLNLEDGSADVHLARLKGWGFNMLRFPVTWEALEHEGPGKYDYTFMDYTIRVLRKCKEYGFKVYIDPHQDVWSRFSGGSGAPYWTLLACGMNPLNFTATQCAILHSEYPVAYDPKPESLPAMIWSTNYGRLVTQTVFTLFFAGKDYAPKCIIDGQNIQDYLQSHFIAAFGELADRIRDAGDLMDECVIGWDSMNEPAEGFCGDENLNTVPEEQGSTLRKGSRPTPAQSLRLGMGQEQTVEHWAFGKFGPKRDGTVTIDPKGIKMWLDPDTEVDGFSERWGWTRDPGWKLGTCIWALHGVWDIETGYVLKPAYFHCPPFDPDRPVVFEADYWRPHWRAYSARIREAHPEGIHFIEPPVFALPPTLDEPDDLRGRCCYSGHYYDGLTLVTRHWNWFNADALGLLRGKYKSTWMAAKFGERAIRQSLQEQLTMLKSDAEILGPYPTIIGEIGTPFDMDNKRSYGWTDGGKHAGDYSSQQRALDASLNAADGPNALNYTIWTYCPDSSHKWGDGWNMEDLSLWSTDDLRNVPAIDSYRMRNADSEAALIKKKSAQAFVRVKEVAHSSSAVSLTTLGEASIAPSYDDEDLDKSNHHSLGTLAAHPHWANHYDFLTDGARAVRAFCRPFPAAVVGLPVHIAFDIVKAEFKLTVKVRAEDRPVNCIQDSASGSSTPQQMSDAKDDAYAELPTEIFVPLVHFARQDIIARSAAGYMQGNEEAETSPTDDAPETPASLQSSATLPTSSLVDIDVQVSSGKWSIEGQYLRWWYEVPSSEDAPDLEHTIQINRVGGPIRLADDPTASAIAASSSFWDLCDKMCPKDRNVCCIM